MIKTNFSVNVLFSRLMLSGLCLIMGFQASAQLAQEPQLSDIQEIQILKNSNSFDKKLELVKSAKHSIWMAVMVFDCRASSKELFNEMIKKQEEGLDVRIIAEGLYMKTIAHPCYKYLKNNKLKVTQVFDHLRKGGDLTRMMHQKYFIIDGEEVVMGGQNFHKYENDATFENNYVRDTDVYIKSPRIAQAVAEEFVWLWNFFTKYEKIENFQYVSQNDPLNKSNCRILVQNPRRGLDEADQFIKDQLRVANQSLKMYSPGVSYGKSEFFSLLKDKVNGNTFNYELIRPGHAQKADEIDMVLQDALKNSLRKFNPVGIVFSALGKWVNKLLRNGAINKELKSLKENYGDKITVYDYPRYSHSKVYIFDEKIAMIGSMNLDDHSLDNNYEIAFSCDDPRFVSQLVEMFNEDLLKTTKTIGTDEKVEGQVSN